MEKLKQAAMEAVATNETTINKLRAKRELAFEKLQKISAELKSVEENQKGLVCDLNELITKDSRKSTMHNSCSSDIGSIGIRDCHRY